MKISWAWFAALGLGPSQGSCLALCLPFASIGTISISILFLVLFIKECLLFIQDVPELKCVFSTVSSYYNRVVWPLTLQTETCINIELKFSDFQL